MYSINIFDNTAVGGNRLALSAREYNRRGRLPVLLLHGFCCPSDMYEYQILPLVNAGCRVITCDFCGFGRSDYAAHTYDYDCLAKQVNALITALDLSCLCIVGYDVGGCAALRYLRLYRREGSNRGRTPRVRKLILLSTPSPFIVYENEQGAAVSAMSVTTRDTATTATSETVTSGNTSTLAAIAAATSEAAYLSAGTRNLRNRFNSSVRRAISETPVSNFINEVMTDKPEFCGNFVRNSFFASPQSEASIEYYIRMCADKSSVIGMSGMLKAIRDEDGLRDLECANVPCTVIYGEQDNFVTPATIELQISQLRGSKLLLLENSGHFIVYDELAEFNNILVNEVVINY